MASEQKISKALNFVQEIEKHIVHGDRDAILEAVSSCEERNHLVALGTRLKHLSVPKADTTIFTHLTKTECQTKISELLDTIFDQFHKFHENSSKNLSTGVSSESKTIVQTNSLDPLRLLFNWQTYFLFLTTKTLI